MGQHQLTALSNNDTFEKATRDLFNQIDSTITYKLFGKNGHSQKGIDVFSTEKDCAIQCKKKDLTRKDTILKKEIINDIEKDVNKVIEEKLRIKIDKLIFVSTYKDHPDIDEYCEILREKLQTEFEIIYWGWDTLESKFLEQPILLEKYWSNFIIKPNVKIEKFKRNLELKKKIELDFGKWLCYTPENRQTRSRMLIRAFDSEQYPNSNEPDDYGEYTWFNAEIKSLYFKGIEFIIGIEEIQVFDDYSWSIIKDEEELTGNLVKVGKIGQISFTDIIDYDVDGDEFGNYPHIFCDFKYEGTPFENTYYYNLNKTFEYFEVKNRRK